MDRTTFPNLGVIKMGAETQDILDVHVFMQRLIVLHEESWNEIVLLKREVESLKRIITEGVVDDNSVKSMTSRLFDSVQELQDEHGISNLTHTLLERERLQ